MTSADVPLLLDTNIVVHLLRGRAAGRWLDTTFSLRRRSETPLLSAVSLGELLALATKWRWKAEKHAEILELGRMFVVVDIYRQEILESYAKLGVTWEKKGKRLEQNDLWIAATAAATHAAVLTTDNDFRKLSQVLDVHWVDPEMLKEIERS